MATQVCSADHFWIQPDGSYKWEGARLPEAHAACMRKFIGLVKKENALGRVGLIPTQPQVTILRGVPGSGKSTFIKANPQLGIVVDNVSLHVADVAPYCAVAQAYGLSVKIITIYCDPRKAGARNQHGVPPERVVTMYDALLQSDAKEYWPAWWDMARVVSE